MSNKKDMRRADLIIPYQVPTPKDNADMSGTLASTLPMAAMFTRNKFVGWASVVFATQTWLGESPDTAKAGTGGIFSVGMSIMALVITYLPLFLPPVVDPRKVATGTEAPAAAPPS